MGKRVAILFLIAFCRLVAEPARIVRVTVFPHAPAIFQGADGRVQGFYADMIEEVARQRGWQVQYLPGSWAEGLERLRRGEADLGTSVAYTAERAAYLDYGRQTTYTVWSILYANPRVPMDSVLDARDRRIAVMKGDRNGQNFRDLCEHFAVHPTYLEVGTFEDVLAAVASGEADGGVTTNLFGYAREADYRVQRTPLVFNPFPIHFATPKGRNADLLAALDDYLAAGRNQPGSHYTQTIDRWVHAQAQSGRRTMPKWATRTALLLGALLVTAVAAALLFRNRVRAATARVLDLNRELQEELEERRRREATILEVARGVSAASGETFFAELVRHLARATEADAAFIAEAGQRDGAPWVQAFAVWLDGAPGEPFGFAATGTPCAAVLGGEACVAPREAQLRYPDFALLRDLGVVSYVACPLLDASGRSRGLMAVMKRRVESRPEGTVSLLRIFATRAAAELERRASERDRSVLERQMQHVQKLESLGLLAGGIAHDFNNFLTAMLGHLSIAQARLSPESPATPSLSSLERIIHRTTDLVRQLLAYSGKGRFVVQDLDLNRVIREMLHLLEVSIPKAVALHLDLCPETVPITADAAQVQQVLMNLVTNAADAIGEAQGTIRVGTRLADLDRAYLDQVFQGQDLVPGRYALLEVHDTGCGMSPEVQARIFDPFFTTKPTGHGLGLSATLGILRGHRAGLRIYSEPGRGSTFRVLFPATAGAPAEAPAPPPPAATLEGMRVLVVDDEAFLREATTEALEMMGVRVEIARDGQEAVDFVAGPGGAGLDLVFMDLTMPRKDGRQAFAEIRKTAPDLPVVLTSGYDEQASVQEFIGRGLAGFLQKPYTLHTLRETLQRFAPAGRDPSA